MGWSQLRETEVNLKDDNIEIDKGPYQKNRRFSESNMFLRHLTPPYPPLREHYCENHLMVFIKKQNILSY